MAIESVALTSPVAAGRDILRVSEVKIRSSRLDCIDLLRGIVMVLMALDHTRDFFTGLQFAPEDLSRTSAPLFFTRFVTHFCAPVFFLLAGTGAYLSLSRGKSVAQVSTFFATRGLWLIFLDLTVMAVAWTFVYPFWFSGVLWSIGWAMIAMALLVWLPLPAIAAVGAGMILTHNLLDGITPRSFDNFTLARLWVVLHGHGLVPIGSQSEFFILFPLIPWVGVMAVGYALGALLRRPDWRKLVFGIGAMLTAAFLLSRFFHLYGSAHGGWKVQASPLLNLVAFFDTSKYPPSLQFLLMTLGPALMALPWLDRVNAERGLARVLQVFGRVPLFYYVLHLFLIHTLAILVANAVHQPSGWLRGGPMMLFPPEHYGHGLPFIYAMWATVVVLLYLPCKWFMEYKRRHSDWWLSYL
ncbi:MAG TPA: heparan-alpha-glucosaminide N-acetyltransferase domain-containing protein [Candidatus Sulfotelmatobacter sp.]|nr:heparan-alpha-glucosaminide N-acetyltransferase domain-containing protein [Candidatus Sulfotelmatobacter sp.]